MPINPPTAEQEVPSTADVIEFVQRRLEQRKSNRRRPADVSDAWDWYLPMPTKRNDDPQPPRAA